MRALMALLVLTVVLTAAPAIAAPPWPDPDPSAQRKATISGSYWVDVPLYDSRDRLVHGARARCRYRAEHPRRCFVIRVRVR